MSTTADSATQAAVTMFKPLRTWIPLLLLSLMIGARFVADVWTDGPSWTWAITAFFAFLFSLMLILWWLLLSRARYTERLSGLLALIVILPIQQLLSHETMRGPVFIVMTIPMTINAFALGLILPGKQFTQEQRGDEEAVVCYESESGRQVWEKKWASRFFEALGGLGPRSTPAYADGSIYALGADGVLIRLNVRDGSIVWQADVKLASDRSEAPMWGFSASPLLVKDLVIVVSETGGLFLLRANSEKHEELAQVSALSDKTWNHPVLISDRLFLRNATEAVAYQLPLK